MQIMKNLKLSYPNQLKTTPAFTAALSAEIKLKVVKVCGEASPPDLHL